MKLLRMGNDSKNVSTVYHCDTCNKDFPNKKVYDIHKNQTSHPTDGKANTITKKRDFGRPGVYVRGTGFFGENLNYH